jgi:redox-sensing transcriptional repressor
MSEGNKNERGLSMQAVQRMPYYLDFLKKQQEKGAKLIPASTLADEFGLSEIQARKDLASVCKNGGRPRTGFVIEELINDIETILGFRDTSNAVLVGVGHLGQALMNYGGFESYGLNILAAFDSDEKKIGSRVNGKQVFAAGKVSELCRRMNIHIGIITVPSEHAQVVCDQLVAGGVMGVWNFAPVYLSVPERVMVQNENMAASLALLSKHVLKQLETE